MSHRTGGNGRPRRIREGGERIASGMERTTERLWRTEAPSVGRPTIGDPGPTNLVSNPSGWTSFLLALTVLAAALPCCRKDRQ